LGGPSVGPDEVDEAAAPDHLALERAVRAAPHAHEALLLAAPEGAYEAPAGGQLLEQRPRDLGPARRDEDRVVGRVGGAPERAVAEVADGVGDAERVEVAAGPRGEPAHALDRDHARHEPGEDRGLVARAGADLERGLTAFEREGLGHRRDDPG